MSRILIFIIVGVIKMDNNKKTIIEKRIAKVGENLKKNNMEFYYAETKDKER